MGVSQGPNWGCSAKGKKRKKKKKINFEELNLFILSSSR
jgi:hypothetical protein